MRVSVVIPCHNSLRWLPETLDSVLAQELSAEIDAFEVVLVDDGGEDQLAQWADELAQDRVRVVRQENAGVSAARNRGIASSHGELVAFCDSDDLWLPDTLANLVAALDADERNGMAYGWYEIIDGLSEPTGSVHRCDWQGAIWEQLITANPVGASGVIVRRGALDDVGVFRVNRDRFPIDVEDWELWLRIADRWSVGLHRGVVCQHRRHDSNSTSDVASLEQAYAHLFEVVFDGAPPQRRALRPVAEANASLILGWQWLNDRDDPVRALAHLRRAARLVPSMRRTPEWWRLKVAATALSVGGRPGYRAMRGTNAALRRAKHRRAS